MQNKGIYEKYFKRLIDFIVSLVTFTLILPFLLIIALLIKVKLGSPILFKQNRPGLNEKIFTLYKFRTMTNKINSNGSLLPDRERITKFGNFLRKTSIDELPSLINIIKGDLSIIGPRPLLEDYLPFYNKEQKKRHSVRPGLTGLAQVNGRNGISWEKKFKLDITYVENVTFLHDIVIIFKTILKVVKREGISSSDSVTMDKFNGNSN